MSPSLERSLPTDLLEGALLPSLPSVAAEVVRLCREGEPPLEDLARVIGRDPALAAKLLRYANSSLFGPGQEVSTLPHAALILGQKRVQVMALSFSLAKSLPRTGPGLDYETFWRRSVAHAVAARALALLVERDSEDEAFLCGLLSGIGQLLLAQCFPPYADVLEAAGKAWPSAELELRTLGFDRSDAGMALLRSWSLPPLIHLGVGYMHRPEELPSDAGADAASLVRLLQISGLAVELLIGGSSEALGELERLFAERYDLGSGRANAYLLKLEAEFRETADLLELPRPTRRAHAEILEDARMELVRVSMESLDELRRARQASLDLSHRKSIPADPAYVDPVTGLMNAAGFEAFLLCEARARLVSSMPQALGVLLFEVDRFARVQERYGEAAGDDVLRAVAGVLGRMTRKVDLTARLAGPRFGVALLETSPLGLRTLAERIRHAVQMQAISAGARAFHPSVSLGGACLGRVTRLSNASALLEACTRYLERAQAKGGNQAELHKSVVHHE